MAVVLGSDSAELLRKDCQVSLGLEHFSQPDPGPAGLPFALANSFRRAHGRCPPAPQNQPTPFCCVAFPALDFVLLLSPHLDRAICAGCEQAVPTRVHRKRAHCTRVGLQRVDHRLLHQIPEQHPACKAHEAAILGYGRNGFGEGGRQPLPTYAVSSATSAVVRCRQFAYPVAGQRSCIETSTGITGAGVLDLTTRVGDVAGMGAAAC